ncbi:HTH-type transcriptional regulator CatM [Cupriavidus yeoncheonensis]|uniref:HTH-type transcriptional regulator CatM n=1 Tax=Cupriavidus yeoncheonensis TaxID=1462994 RepID=A0A916IX19_9BURK|nr:LysR family transcriptional regulator [Cupriavidus yeoncheonensis]CAG2153845.1 HTH-type transcriptional regulator CatM [Cupriavidus yeoncheonensis]
MDPKKLSYFATVVEQGSLAKAAKRLTISQPALSKSMDRLESELGMKLLERSPAGILPTALGELIYSHARAIRDEMDIAAKRLEPDREQVQTINLGTLPSLTSNVIPRAVSKWRQQHPDVLLRVVEKVQVELLLGLLRGEFDFIVGQTEFYDVFLEGLKQRVLFRDRLCVFARADHPLFRLSTLSWADLAQYPWICPMVGWPQRTILEKLVTAEGLDPPRQLVECGSIDFTKSLIASSDHLALLPAHAAISQTTASPIKALPITVAELKRDIAVIFRERAPLREISQDLIHFIREVGNDLASATDTAG